MIEIPSLSPPGWLVDAILYIAGVLSGIIVFALKNHYQDYIQKKNELDKKVYSPLLDEITRILEDELPYEEGDYQSLRTYQSHWEEVDSRLKLMASDDVQKKAEGIVYRLGELGDLEEDANDIDYPGGLNTNLFDLYRNFSREFVKSDSGEELLERLEAGMEGSSRRGWSNLIESLEDKHGDNWPAVLLAQVTDRQKGIKDILDLSDKRPIEQLWDNIYERRREYQSIQSRAESFELILKDELNRPVVSFIVSSWWAKFSRYIPSRPTWMDIQSKIGELR
jgi:hypothetical protein